MSKYLRRAKRRLEARIKSYEQLCSDRLDRGQGFRKPGTMKKAR